MVSSMADKTVSLGETRDRGATAKQDSMKSESRPSSRSRLIGGRGVDITASVRGVMGGMRRKKERSTLLEHALGNKMAGTSQRLGFTLPRQMGLNGVDAIVCCVLDERE